MLPSITKNFILRLGIDIDNTIGDFASVAKSVVREETGETLMIENLGMRFPSIKGISTQKLIFDTHLDRIISEMQPYPDAVDAAKRLSQHYYITYVTFRKKETNALTREWLLKHDFPNPDNVFHAVGSKVPAPVQYIIDDNKSVIDEFYTRGRFGVLLGRYHYNRIFAGKVRNFAADMTTAADILINLRKK